MPYDTQIISVYDANGAVDETVIESAAELLRSGETVAIPTETVYGLAANALDAQAVAKIFEAKGRPANNPLIVHVADIDQAKSLAAEWPDEAEILACEFWPGPLTIVLKKREIVPDIVTAGGDTVALRCPGHPAALALIKACGFPLAAPSANRSNYISPTTAQHVNISLGGRIPLILDGGPCRAGIESTVLSLMETPARILRPGSVTLDTIKKRLGADIIGDSTGAKTTQTTEQPRALLSPGQLPRHYSPNTPIQLVQKQNLISETERLRSAGQKIISVPLPQNPDQFATNLYRILYDADRENLDLILIEKPPDTPEWSAVADRLTRASRR